MEPIPAEAVETAPVPEAAPAIPFRQRIPAASLGFTAAFLALILLPRVRENPRLTWTFAAIGAALLAWAVLVWMRARERGQALRIDFVPIKSHYVQASVQFAVYLYWGWYWRPVYAEMPLILAQLLFLYAVTSLLAWTRGRPWQLGFGPFPIIFSTNLFMWFKDDWFFWQFLMVATGALGKELVTWIRNGRRVHIFNPSAFGLGLFSIVLIATDSTRYTWGVEVATTLAQPPHIYLEIFLVGLVVQYFFSVTLMTLSAAGVLYLMNVIYTKVTGVYLFLDTNIPIAVFLGLHLLMTDPATSPRSHVGRVIFGGLYGAANFVLYEWFGRIGVPEFYDKLLPVPILNLLVPWIDRVAGFGLLGSLDRWEGKFRPQTVNRAHMGIWIALFATMLLTGFVDAPHEGASIDFWKRAYAEGKPHAGDKLYRLALSQAEGGSASASNELGVLYMEGKVTKEDRAAAAHYFGRACKLGDLGGCANVARQFLVMNEARSEADVARALDRLEQDRDRVHDGRISHLLGLAYESGRGRPQDPARARALYEEGCRRENLDACKALVRLNMSGAYVFGDLAATLPILERGCEAGDAESCLYLASILRDGSGVPPDAARSRTLMDRACALGSRVACEARK